MTTNPTKHLLIISLVIVMFSGCRSKDAASIDNRVVWDKEGCAYTIEPNVGDTSFVRPMKDADRDTCHRE